MYPRHDPTLEGTLRNNPSPPPGSTLNIKSSMSCCPHTLLRTNVTLHVIRRKETTPVSNQTNEPMCTLTLTHYATASKKQLRSLSRREFFYLLKEITEGVLGQVLGCDVREHLLGRRIVKGDLVLLDKLAHGGVPKGDMLGSGTEHAISRNAECSCAVATDGDL